MEKQGVCSGEGEAPKPTEKTARDAPVVGTDLLSKMAAEQPGVKRGDAPLPPKK